LERKLTAILCADVYGYSRLMGQDEEATLRTLSSHRKVVDSLIEQHRGRFVNSAGDSILAEFASVVNAVQCAVEIQTTLKAENANLPPERRMEFRIGVNLGDVIVDGEQIYGDGVNVAARLESLAQPGGICISGTVHEQIRDKLVLGYVDLGDQQVKNIARPVRVYRVLSGAGAAAPRKTPSVARKNMRRGGFSIAGVAIIIGTILLVQHVSLKPPHTHALIPPLQSPALTLPDQPSIAVLPLTNMSGDREQEYFSDGITDDLITDLSRLPGLFVIARTSSFTYKGKEVKLQDVGTQLGVKYLLGGGVRKVGGQVRITVQLADATTGEELWAERYDRPLRNIFALQDEIVRRIVTTLNLQISLAQRGVLIPRETENLEAYDYLLRGTQYSLTFTKDGNAKARQMFEKAIALDPKYARAYAALGQNYYAAWGNALSPDARSPERAFQLAQQAVTLDESLAPPHSLLAQIYVFKGQYDQAVAEAQRGITLNPNSALGYGSLANVKLNMQRSGEALAAVEKAMRLDPRNRDQYLFIQGVADSQIGRYEEAIPALKRHFALTNNPWDRIILARAYIELGQEDDAEAEAAEVERWIELNPKSAMGYWMLAYLMNLIGEPAQALVAAEKAQRLNPGDGSTNFAYWNVGWAYLGLGQYQNSITAFKRDLALHPGFVIDYFGLAVDYIELGQDDAARAWAAELRKINPQFHPDMVFPTVGPKGKVLAQNARWSADLRKAGLK
jgi:adenylate cyclase